MGKRKFELLTSAAHNAESPAPEYKGSFTKALNKALPQLLKEHDNGFLTSDLFSELYHSVPKHLPRPHLFDQSRHDYGKIRIRPQNFTAAVKHEAQAYFLNMTLRINVEPEDVIIYELAKGLSFLPHVNEVRFEKMYEPLGDFFTSVRRTQIAKTLLRLRDKYRARKMTAALREGFREDLATASAEIPAKQTSQNLPLKSPTWPLTRGTMCPHTKIASGPILHTETQIKVSGTEALTSGSLSEGKRKSSCLEHEQDIGTVLAHSCGISHFDLHPKTLTVEQELHILLKQIWICLRSAANANAQHHPTKIAHSQHACKPRANLQSRHRDTPCAAITRTYI